MPLAYRADWIPGNAQKVIRPSSTSSCEYEPAVSLEDAKAHGWEPVPGLPQPSDTPER